MSKPLESVSEEQNGNRESLPYDSIFRPVHSGNAFEETVERLAQAVKLGVVAPGSKLPSERELVTLLQVSRSTLREAIRVLEQSGYLRAHRGRSGGTFVIERQVKSSAADARQLAQQMGDALLDTLDFRWAVEPATAELAAVRATPADVERLKTLLEATLTVPRSAYRQSNSRFHLAIAEITGSQSLVTAVVGIQMRLCDLLAAIPLLEKNLRHSNRQHEAIVNAIAHRDGKCARTVMEEHIMGTANLLRGFLG